MEYDVVFCLAMVMAMFIMATPRFLGHTMARRRLNSIDYQKAYYQLAQATGMAFEPGLYASSPHVTGRYRERQVTVNLKVESLLPLSVFTRVTIYLKRPSPGYVQIRENGWLARVIVAARQKFRQGEVSEFSGRFAVTSAPIGLGQRLLASSNLRRKLLATRSIEIECKDQSTTLMQAGILADPEKILFLLDLLSEVARLIESDEVDYGRTSGHA